MDPSTQITLALTHFNREAMLLESFAQVIDDPRIGEVVISDDASTDGSYERLVQRFQGTKVKVFRNSQNLDCYANKAEAVWRSQFDWVILFDSDNIIGKGYLDVLYALPKWEEGVIYCPDFAMPHFPYFLWSGVTIDRHNVSSFMGQPVLREVMTRKGKVKRMVLDPAGSRFRCLLNTANYFVPRALYLKVWDDTVDPHTADSIYFAYLWLKSGGKLRVVPGLRYIHRIHPLSHYRLNCHKTGEFLSQVEQKLMNLR